MMDKLLLFFRNSRYIHHRWMMRFLRRRGWVVFYLEPKYRYKCSDPSCFFRLYLDGEK
jgi:Xaa-Pro aminopeptidase